MALLRRHNVAFCSYDMPGVECPLVTTAGFAYVRFHGTGARYQGKYTEAMLEEWGRRLKRLASEVDDVYVYFNNDARANAVANAATLAGIVGVSLPEPVLAR